jgi:endonuclease/exonuclease/phosphatase family metal-dependent hydrolase
VLSWNLWWRFGPWEERLPAIVEVIHQLDPDVVALQEVWVADGTSSAHHIGAALGHHVAVEHRLELDGVGFGNAVLARWPITATSTVARPAAARPRDEERLVLAAEIDSPTGQLQVFCTHLNWRFDHSAVRQEQVRALCATVASKRPRTYPAIVCGDFNASPDSDEIRMMTGRVAVPSPGTVFFDAWEATNGASGGTTWSNDNPFAAEAYEHDRRIDYVFTGWRRSDGQGHPLSCRVVGDEPVGGVWPSDHFGVLATLRA